MKAFNKKLILIPALMAILASLPNQGNAVYGYNGDESSHFEGTLDLKAFVESNRKDWFDRVYKYNSPTPTYEKKQYDKSFYGTDADLNLALKTDLNDTSFLDLKESLYVRHYNREDPDSLSYKSNRHNELDHNLRLTFGVAAGLKDYFQLDYINNIEDGGVIESLNYKSNKGRVLALHEFAERTCVAFTGSYEEREYDTDKEQNYKEARAGFEISTLLPGRDEYVQISSSTRGEKSTFEKVPGAMAAKNAIDFYTTYRRNPRDDDPTAKYVCNQKRGELYLRGFGEIAQRNRVNLNNDCDEVVAGAEAIYKTSDNMRFRLHEVYTKQDFKWESNKNFLHDCNSNYIALSVDYDCTEKFSQSLIYSNEIYNFGKAEQEDNKANSITYESFYCGKNYRVGFVVGAVVRKFDQNTELNPDETEKRASITYDYTIVKDLKLKLKAEYADLDYHEFENDINSNYKRKTWNVAIEKGICDYVSFELAYQSNSERHEEYTQNDIEEKTVGISLIGRF